jgi:predicted amidohydrolase YtcJ
MTLLKQLQSGLRKFWGADRIGSLQEGKDADIVVWDGKPLNLDPFPLRTDQWESGKTGVIACGIFTIKNR